LRLSAWGSRVVVLVVAAVHVWSRLAVLVVVVVVAVIVVSR